MPDGGNPEALRRAAADAAMALAQMPSETWSRAVSARHIRPRHWTVLGAAPGEPIAQSPAAPSDPGHPHLHLTEGDTA